MYKVLYKCDEYFSMEFRSKQYMAHAEGGIYT